MSKELYLYKLRITKNDNTYDETFEKDIIQRIGACTTYLDFRHKDKSTNKEYYFLQAEKSVSNYYFGLMKKITSVKKNYLDESTEKYTIEEVESNESIRCGINLSSNLIGIVKKGNFGMDQFTIAFKQIFTEALRKEFQIELGTIEFISVPGIPKSWNEENLMEKIKDLNSLKQITMKFYSNHVIADDKESTIMEKKYIKSENTPYFSTKIFPMKNLEEKYSKFLDKTLYNSIELNCIDSLNQNYIISKKEAFSYSFNFDIIDKEIFISKTQDTIEDYIQKYLNQ